MDEKVKFFNRSSMCILNYLGRMDEYVEHVDLDRSSNQFRELVPKISKYVDGIDPRIFFVDKKLEDQDEFDPEYNSSYLEIIVGILSRYAKTIWTRSSNPLKELIDVLDNLLKVDPEMLDKSIVCTQNQFEDIRSEYLNSGKVKLNEILKKDYSTRYKIDSIWV